MDEKDRGSLSGHILATSSNLFGLCFVILSFFKISGGAIDKSMLDELVGVSMIVFLISSILSYISIRSGKEAGYYEKAAEAAFMFGLAVISIISIIVIFEIA